MKCKFLTFSGDRIEKLQKYFLRAHQIASEYAIKIFVNLCNCSFYEGQVYADKQVTCVAVRQSGKFSAKHLMYCAKTHSRLKKTNNLRN